MKEWMLFWNSLAFSMIQQMLTIWSLIHLLFLNPAWTSESSQFTCCWSLAWRILSITLLALRWVQLCDSLNFLGNYLSSVMEWKWKLEHWKWKLSLELKWKLTFLTPVFHCWVFQICQHNECSTFTASSFRTWNSSAGIPSPSLILFTVMLPKAHLASHSRNVWL